MMPDPASDVAAKLPQFVLSRDLVFERLGVAQDGPSARRARMIIPAIAHDFHHIMPPVAF